jgi:sorbitol-specific phosphotransferase system component IIC
MPDWIKASRAASLNTMVMVACAIVVGALLFWNAWTFAYVFWIGTSPLPFGDQWDAGLFPEQWTQNLFGLHNEHRPALARLVGALDWYLADARNGVNATFIAVCYPVVGLVLFKLVNTIVGDWRRAAVIAGLASAIILTLAQWENLLWPFQTHFVGSFVFALLALFFAARTAPPSQSPRWKTVNVLVCLFASFFAVSLASGLLVLPFVAALFFILGASPRLKYGYIVFVIIVLGLYFYRYASPNHLNPLAALRNVWAVGNFALAYLGSPFTRGDPSLAAVVGASGVLALIVVVADAVITFLREPRLLQASKGAAYLVLLLFAVFIFCADGATALGRVIDFGIEGALAPRYATPAVFFWAGLVAACLVQPYVRRSGSSSILCWGGAVLGVALASTVAFQQRAYVASMYNKRAERFNAAIAYLLGIRNQPVIFPLYPQPAVFAGHLDEPFERLRHARKSIFAAEDWMARLGTPLREWKPDLSRDCRGAIERRAIVPDQAEPISELAGWAWDDERRRVPDLIAFTDARDLVLGFAAPGFRRVDLREQQVAVTSSAAGWNGFVRADQTVTIHAYGVMLGRSNRACEFATSFSSQ